MCLHAWGTVTAFVPVLTTRPTRTNMLHPVATTTTTTTSSTGPRNNIVLQGTTTTSDEDNRHFLEHEYEQRELQITERGLMDERLMANMPSTILQANNEAAAAAAAAAPINRGFGGTGKSSSSSTSRGSSRAAKRQKWKDDNDNNHNNTNNHKFTQEAKYHAQVLRQEGLVRIDGALSEKVVDELRTFLLEIRTAQVEKAKLLQSKFPTIRRWDLSVPLFDYHHPKNNDDTDTTDDDTTTDTTTPTIAHQALTDILQRSVVGETMKEFLGTTDATLYEFSSYISDPGSSRQVIHADTPCFGDNDSQPVLCTCFVALQDVRPDMGPTVWLPQTNTREMHHHYFGEDHADDGSAASGKTPKRDAFLQSRPSVVGLLPKGACVLFDSRVLHCGTANRSEHDSRALFFFSFLHPNVQLYNPGGDLASIRSDIRDKFKLSDFVT